MRVSRSHQGPWAKAEGQQALDAVEDIDLGGRAKQNFDGGTGSGFTLTNHLAASTTRGTDLRAEVISLATDDGQFADGHVGIVGPGIKEGGALSTESRGIGGILLVASGDDLTIVEQYGSTHFEARIGGI